MNLPYDIEAEKAVLGAIMLDNRVLVEVASILKADDFYHHRNRLVYAVMLTAALENDPIDAVTVGSRLTEGQRKEIGGVIYLSTLPDNIGAVSSVSAYVKKVKYCSIRRAAIVAACRAAEMCEREDFDVSQVLGEIEKIREIEQIGGGTHQTVKLAAGIREALTGLKRFSAGDNLDKVPLGIRKIDRAMRGGMIHGALYLLGAPSGAGKTTLLQNIAVNCARTRGTVLFVSPEMATWELSEREIIRRSGFTLDSRGPWVRYEEQIEAEVAHVRAACEIEEEALDVHCIDDIDIGMAEICAKARTIPRLKLVIVDYAQEVADMSASVARYLAVGDVGKDAIRLGKELGCPVLIASQVNIAKSGSKLEYSFRESSKLHHKAHCSMIMEVKRSEIPNSNGYFEVESARIFSMKNRSGPMFSVDINYDPATFRIGEFKQPEPRTWAPDERQSDDY